MSENELQPNCEYRTNTRRTAVEVRTARRRLELKWRCDVSDFNGRLLVAPIFVAYSHYTTFTGWLTDSTALIYVVVRPMRAHPRDGSACSTILACENAKQLSRTSTFKLRVFLVSLQFLPGRRWKV